MYMNENQRWVVIVAAYHSRERMGVESCNCDVNSFNSNDFIRCSTKSRNVFNVTAHVRDEC